MNNITLTVNKANVYTEVAKTTSYAGAKMQGDEGAYERVFTTDADRMMLERFWAEASNVATGKLRRHIVRVTSYPESHGVELDRNYEVELTLSSSFDPALTNSISSSLFSFFVYYIIGKWFGFSNKNDAPAYIVDADLQMEEVLRKIFHRKKPQRTVIG